MTLFQNKYRIETTRLKNWDYSSVGYYFFTICTKNRANIFGEIKESKIINNTAGQIVWECWNDLPNHYSNMKLDEFIVMPNHIHGIIHIITTTTTTISTDTIQNQQTKKNHGLSEYIRALKSFSSRRINKMDLGIVNPIWQSRFHDRIIRTTDELYRVRTSIQNNAATWQKDNLF